MVCVKHHDRRATVTNLQRMFTNGPYVKYVLVTYVGLLTVGARATFLEPRAAKLLTLASNISNEPL